MVNPFRTLRFRLVLLNLAVFGSILAALGFVVLVVADRFLRTEFDRRLINGAQSMVEAMEIAAEESPEGVRESRFRPHLNPFHFLEYYFQIRNRDGRLLEKSANMLLGSLPFSGAAQASRSAGGPVLETLADETAIRLLGQGHQLRLLTLYHERFGMPPFYLQVGVSLTAVDHAMIVLRRTLLLLIPVGLLLAAAASERLVRQGLAPIGRVAREARQLTAAHLDRRLPLPAGHDEVVELIHTLNGLLDRLDAAFAAQERFIANAAHELKTPVTHLLGQAQVLARQARKPEEYQAFVSAVQDDMRHLAMIVESLLLLARADAGLPLESHTRVSINEVVADAVERCHPYAAQCRVRLEPTLCAPTTEEEEPQVEGDAELLTLMMLNLMRNAIRFSPPDGCVEIDVARSSRDGQVTIAVRDRGPGIAPEQMPRLFERFYQAQRNRGPTGTGLGLSIAQSVAKLHRGHIHVESRPGGGSVFAVGLPLSPRDLASPPGAE